jgi:predicted transcriptional regulator YdeE
MDHQKRAQPTNTGILVMKQVEIQEFIVSGASVRTNNKVEAGASGKIAGLWGQFYSTQPKPEDQLYGVYSDYESDVNGEYTVTAGKRVASSTDACISIRSGTYLVFPASGAMPKAIIDAWIAVWEHFSHAQPYVRAYETDFEEYDGAETAAIYIGIMSGN